MRRRWRRQPVKRKVLIVEDDLADLLTTVARMELKDYDLLSSTSGAEAVLIASAYRGEIALILMDLMLPSLPGVEAIKKIRQFLPDVPILAMTAYGEKMRRPALDAGASAFIVKDDPVEVVRKAREMLRG